MPAPAQPKIYHIVHVDRLASVVDDGFLWCDIAMQGRQNAGPTIGMSNIKHRRMNELFLECRPGLRVGACVPFYFCPRSVMLFLIHRRNPELAYQGGQEPVLHLEADLHAAVAWAEANQTRWAFTFSNAGSRYFQDCCDLGRLGEIDWDAVEARTWTGAKKEGKQAEFLIEQRFPWTLIERIGVSTMQNAQKVGAAMTGAEHRPRIEIRGEWYY